MDLPPLHRRQSMLYKIKLWFSSLWFGRTYREWKLKTEYPSLYSFLKED